jgi:hypothetical protein
LPDEVQIALTKFQMLTKFEMANPMLMVEMARNNATSRSETLASSNRYPPLRGSFLKLQENSGLIYLRGSVQFFETYPGMYVPRPLELSVTKAETTVEQIAREMLSLSKLNWNNTQFDGGEPITLRAARRVGDILKCIPENGTVQPSFRFFI